MLEHDIDFGPQLTLGEIAQINQLGKNAGAGPKVVQCLIKTERILKEVHLVKEDILYLLIWKPGTTEVLVDLEDLSEDSCELLNKLGYKTTPVGQSQTKVSWEE